MLLMNKSLDLSYRRTSCKLSILLSLSYTAKRSVFVAKCSDTFQVLEATGRRFAMCNEKSLWFVKFQRRLNLIQ